MHEVVRSIEKWKPLRAARLPSLAGSGLPERMRTTAFAFLGLTAAAGLALVAIFAQIGFHVLSPAPLPGEPVEKTTVAKAAVVDRAPAATRQHLVAAAPHGPAGGSAGSGPAGGEPATPPPPAPGATAPSGGGVGPEASNPPTGEATSIPPSSPGPTPEQVSSPPTGAATKPAPTPARPAATESAPAPAPGHSQSSVAAEHASDRGVEASSKSAAMAGTTPPATSSSSPPSTEAAPGNGNGKALGQTK